jgi:hypothetical protein
MFTTIGPDRALKDTIMADEWYYWKPDPVANSKVKILVWVKQNGVKRAMSWSKEFCTAYPLPPGRMVYSNCGQSNTTGGNNYYTNSWFKQFVINGLRWAAHLPSSTDAKYLAQVCPTSVTPGQNSGFGIKKASLPDLFSDVKAGKAFVNVYGVNGQKISVKAVTSFKDLKKALPAGCHIVRITDISGRMLLQSAIAQ